MSGLLSMGLAGSSSPLFCAVQVRFPRPRLPAVHPAITGVKAAKCSEASKRSGPRRDNARAPTPCRRAHRCATDAPRPRMRPPASFVALIYRKVGGPDVRSIRGSSPQRRVILNACCPQSSLPGHRTISEWTEAAGDGAAKSPSQASGVSFAADFRKDGFGAGNSAIPVSQLRRASGSYPAVNGPWGQRGIECQLPTPRTRTADPKRNLTIPSS